MLTRSSAARRSGVSGRPPKPRGARGSAALRTALALALLVACSPDPAPGPRSPGPVLAGDDCLIIVLDALAADQLSCQGAPRPTTPVIDELASRGVRFEQAWSPGAWTLASTASLFTGLTQESHGVTSPEARLPRSAFTLARAFGQAGYATAGFVQNPFAGRDYGLDAGFERFEQRAFNQPPDELLTGLSGFLTAPRSAPRFAYLHLRRPHAPYDPAPAHRALFATDADGGTVTGAVSDIERHNTRERVLDKTQIAQLLALYRANLHQVDAALGELLASLDLQHTLVLILSDHGEAFGQHSRLGHNWDAHQELLHVPLVALHPALAAGRVVTEPVSTLDLFPTLGELFALPPAPQPLAGRSLAVALLGGEAPVARTLYASSRFTSDHRGHDQAVRDGRFCLLRHLPERVDHLYDLSASELELLDVSRLYPDDARHLSDALDSWDTRNAAFQLPRIQVGPAEDETLQQLRELGYLEGGR